MAIRRTPAGQQVTSRLIRVNTTRASKEKAYQQEAQTFLQAGNISFDFAKSIQVSSAAKKAKEDSLSLRDESGKLVYPEKPKNLGRFGAAKYDEILSKNYLTAANNDFREYANNLALTNPKGYRQGIADYISANASEIEAAGGASIIPAYTETAYAYAEQQASKIALDQHNDNLRRVQAEIQLSHSQIEVDIAKAAENGDFESLNNMKGAYETQLLASVEENGMPRSYPEDRLAILDYSISDALFKRAVVELGGDVNKITQLETATWKDTSKRSEFKGEVYKKLFDSYDNAQRVTVRKQLQSAYNQVRTQAVQEAARVASYVSGKQIVEQSAFNVVDPTSSKAQDSAEVYFQTQYGQTGLGYLNLANNEYFLSDIEKTGALPKTLNILLADMGTGASGAEYTPDQYANGLVIWKNITKNNPRKTMGLNPKAHQFFSKLDTLNQLSPQTITNNVSYSLAAISNEEDAYRAILQNSGLKAGPRGNIEQVNRTVIKTRMKVDPEHVNEMADVMGMLLFAGDDLAIETAQKYYDDNFVVSPYLYKRYGRDGRSLHAPEKYFDEIGIDAFVSSINNLLYSEAFYNNKKQLVIPELGKDVFLEVIDGAQGIAQYKLVTQSGDAVIVDGHPLIVGPQQIRQRSARIAAAKGFEVGEIYNQQLSKEEYSKIVKGISSDLPNVLEGEAYP